MSRQEAHIVALQATVSSLSAQIAALTGGVVVSKPINNVQASTTNAIGPGIVAPWSGQFSALGGNQSITANFTVLTGEAGAGLRMYELLVDGVSVAQKTMFHNDGWSHNTIVIQGLTQLGVGTHSFGVFIPAGSVANDGDYADITIVEYL